mmetsp:Transcript_54007/g.89409  ORF Transcript_54007/g.89409 Transcript_54007/m.89409 type:complete len:223 (+) Transcript_54007:54-722(+)
MADPQVASAGDTLLSAPKRKRLRPASPSFSECSASTAAPDTPDLLRDSSHSSTSSAAPGMPELVRNCSLSSVSSDGPGSPETTLEEDAPPDHIAHQVVRFVDHAQGALYSFTYRKQHFQVTLGRACNSDVHAGRIARLCYMQFEAGLTKEEVKKYRDTLLRELSRLRGPSAAAAGAANAAKASRIAKRKERSGSVGSSWFSQLGSKHSCLKNSVDPLDQLGF